MLRHLLPAFSISLLAEIATSWWNWARAPTDNLRVYYRGNFAVYAVERLIPWLIIFATLWAIFLMFDRRYATRLKETESPLNSAT